MCPIKCALYIKRYKLKSDCEKRIPGNFVILYKIPAPFILFVIEFSFMRDKSKVTTRNTKNLMINIYAGSKNSDS